MSLSTAFEHFKEVIAAHFGTANYEKVFHDEVVKMHDEIVARIAAIEAHVGIGTEQK